MPIREAPYVPRPYSGDGLIRLADLGLQTSRSQANAVRDRGDRSAQMWGMAGNAIAQGIGTIRQEREMIPLREAAARKMAIENEQLRRHDEAYREGRAAKEADAAKAARLQGLMQEFNGQRVPTDRLLKEFGPRDAADIDKAFDELFGGSRADQQQARIEANELGAALPPGAISQGNMDSLQASPAQAGRTRYVFGPGTAEGPELMPTAAQLDQRRKDEAAANKPKTYQVTVPGPNGQPITRTATEEEMARGVATYREPKGSTPDNEPLEEIIGPDGQPVLVRRSQAVGARRASGSAKPATGLEKRAFNFFNRAQQADEDLEGLEPEIAKLNLGGQAWLQYAPNFAQTDLGQRYRQAQRAFTEARLRKDSGAAIPEQEYENDAKTYFARPGDSAITQTQKRRARAAVLASLGFESGQALGEFVGDRDEAKRIVDEYRTRAKLPTNAAGGGVAGVPDLSGLKPGTGRRFNDGPFSGQTWSIDENGTPYKVGG